MFHFLPIAIRYDGSAPTEGHGLDGLGSSTRR
jgi:hypothetical protein